MFHGFVRMTRILDQAQTALDEIAGSLQKAFAAGIVTVGGTPRPRAPDGRPARRGVTAASR